MPNTPAPAITPTNYSLFTVPQLREEMKRRGFKPSELKGPMVTKLTQDDAEEVEFNALCANPPPLQQGYRCILDSGEEIPFRLSYQAFEGRHHRMLNVRVAYTVTWHGFPHEEYATSNDLHAAMFNARRNIGGNVPLKEFLRPGEKSHAELLAENALLKESLASHGRCAPQF